MTFELDITMKEDSKEDQFFLSDDFLPGSVTIGGKTFDNINFEENFPKLVEALKKFDKISIFTSNIIER